MLKIKFDSSKNMYEIDLEEPPKNLFEKIIRRFFPRRYTFYIDHETYSELSKCLKEYKNLRSFEELVDSLVS
jgi:hypothetical protein